MNSIDLLKYKQFPMSVETLAFMQDMLVLTARLASVGGSTYILDGCVEQGSNVSAGVLVVNGEILPFEGGIKSETVVIQENKESVQVYDVQYADIYISRKVIFGNGSGQLPWSSFIRLPNPSDMANKLGELTKAFELHTKTHTVEWGNVNNKPNAFPPTSHTHSGVAVYYGKFHTSSGLTKLGGDLNITYRLYTGFSNYGLFEFNSTINCYAVVFEDSRGLSLLEHNPTSFGLEGVANVIGDAFATFVVIKF
jgi:hypothetical protein